MAAGRLPAPGSKFGPCEDACKHLDCQETRNMATAICTICFKPIGYDMRFYMQGEKETERTFTHALCTETIIELHV